MEKKVFSLGNSTTACYFNGSIQKLPSLAEKKKSVIITDENVYREHSKKIKQFPVIIIPAGEQHKTQQTANDIIHQLIELGADRNTLLIGMGGGVVTDLTGYVASVYMRGVKFGFIPTTVLAMVDASIGGKNGIDVGVYKNLVGTITQPGFLLYDTTLLKSLPAQEWYNGFAEIIKHACIKDAAMFKELQQNTPDYYRKKKEALQKLIRKNALIKLKVVKNDEFEQGERKLLNFGHTVGHAIETIHNLPHGYAISLGMVFAASLSEQLLNFKKKNEVIDLLKQYHLPVNYSLNTEEIKNRIFMDKKRAGNEMSFVLLEKAGKAAIQKISVTQLQKYITAY